MQPFGMNRGLSPIQALIMFQRSLHLFKLLTYNLTLIFPLITIMLSSLYSLERLVLCPEKIL